MKFEWDEAKRIENLRKHGLDFEEGWKVFDSQLLVEPDDRENYAEDRWSGVGLLDNRIVKIIFTEPTDTTIRIISLRKANQYERQQYTETFKD